MLPSTSHVWHKHKLIVIQNVIIHKTKKHFERKKSSINILTLVKKNHIQDQSRPEVLDEVDSPGFCPWVVNLGVRDAGNELFSSGRSEKKSDASVNYGPARS